MPSSCASSRATFRSGRNARNSLSERRRSPRSGVGAHSSIPAASPAQAMCIPPGPASESVPRSDADASSRPWPAFEPAHSRLPWRPTRCHRPCGARSMWLSGCLRRLGRRSESHVRLPRIPLAFPAAAHLGRSARRLHDAVHGHLGADDDFPHVSSQPRPMSPRRSSAGSRSGRGPRTHGSAPPCREAPTRA